MSPIAVEVFVGNTADPMTLENQINRIKNRFKLSKVVLVGDRGIPELFTVVGMY